MSQQDPTNWGPLPVMAAFFQAFLWGYGVVQIQSTGFHLGPARYQLWDPRRTTYHL